jgi:ferredoxin-NADP reductase/predicted pyridoxine 5'-phosphate oxidase superfamily flavin-nucleotide-binding protein
MARKFAAITFTPTVKDAQTRYGSRDANERFEHIDETGDPLGAAEVEFIEARDGFYQASANEDGWPYVQFRGGPAGFLKVLDGRTLGYADFRGNIQYLSVGNFAANDRVALILMDYANRRRLKIWARAKIVHLDDDPALFERLEDPTYRARVERAIVFTVEATDWNCPQHITPRFTESEIEDRLAPLHARLEAYESTAGAVSAETASDDVLGAGDLELEISGIRQVTPDIRAYELRRPDFGDLPEITPGAHLEVPAPLDAQDGATDNEDARLQTRAYSISSDPSRRDIYEIAVRRDAEGRGGSQAVHARYALGKRIRVQSPRNGFVLHEDDRPAVLIAGGVGITPVKAMAHALEAANRKFQLHFAARSDAHLAFRSELTALAGTSATFYTSDSERRLDIVSVLAAAPENAVIYVCGPDRLIDGVQRAAKALGADDERVRFERFSTATPEADDVAFQVRLERSEVIVDVAAKQTLLDAVLESGVAAEYGCKSGTCGVCAVKVLSSGDGGVVHRDEALSTVERDQAGLMCPCVSRGTGDDLVLDL